VTPQELIVASARLDAQSEGLLVAAKIIAAIRPLFSVDAATLQVTTSIGIGIAAAGTDAETLMRAADEALYQAKASGRNTYRTVAADQESSGQPA